MAQSRPAMLEVEEADNDAALVATAQADAPAFASLFDRYLDSVYLYRDRRLGDCDTAEDATGAIFERAFVNLPRFQR